MKSLEKIKVTPTTSISSVNFTNASPFPRRKPPNDPIRTLLLAASAVAVLTFLGSMIAVLLISAPEM
jgi:hypothetical protein